MGYTTHPAEESVAFGMSAISDVGGSFVHNAKTSREWDELVRDGRVPATRGLARSRDDDLRRAVIQAVMCRMELDLDRIEAEFGEVDFEAEWRALEPLAAEGFCIIEPRRIEVLPRGRLFLRHLAMVFDTYLRAKRDGGPRFSQTV
jgi:oxygen-independent coproporphyrinogen-3 oxidase